MAMSSFKKKRIIAALTKLYGGDRCFYCQREFEGTGGKARTLDHVIPRSRGGADDVSNLVFACSRCNNLKGDRTWWEWVTSPDFRKRREFAERVKQKKPKVPVEVVRSCEPVFDAESSILVEA